jgi:hypothetical protein
MEGNMSSSEYNDRQAEWKKQEDARTVKLGEARGRVTGNIRTTDELRIRIDKFESMSFKSSTDLKNGDSIRITIEKV